MKGKRKPLAARSAAGEKGGRRLHTHFSRYSITEPEREQVFDDSGRMVAGIRGDTLCKTIRGSIHIMRRPPAIGFDTSVLSQAKDGGCRHVLVLDRETGIEYHAPLARIFERGFRFDRQHGEQIALPLGLWNRPGDNPSLPKPTVRASQPLLIVERTVTR